MQYEAKTSTAKAHADLFTAEKKKKKKAQEAQQAAEEDTAGQDTAEDMDLDQDVSPVPGGEEDDDNAEDAPGTDVQEAARKVRLEEALPAAWSVKPNYRLTRDWVNWPSAGKTGNVVHDVRQAQHSITTDTVFETVKVSCFATLSQQAPSLTCRRLKCSLPRRTRPKSWKVN